MFTGIIMPALVVLLILAAGIAAICWINSVITARQMNEIKRQYRRQRKLRSVRRMLQEDTLGIE